MVIFRVTENINIKTTDGTLVKYLKLRNPSQLLNTSLYITTYNELERLEDVFSRVGEQYEAKVLLENRVTSNNAFPKELGILNKFEYKSIKTFQETVKGRYQSYQEEFPRFFLNEKPVNIDEQLQDFEGDEISIAVLGNVGEHIGETVASLTALRLFYLHLFMKYKTVKMDLYLEASENKFYSRDKEILKTQKYLDGVYPLSVSVKKFCEYDFYIDNSSIKNRSFYHELPYVDAYLHKFGIDYTSIPNHKKYNMLNLDGLRIKSLLKERLESLRKESKLLLFHPYAAEPKRSMPKEVALKMIKRLTEKLPDYTIVSALNIGEFAATNYVNLSMHSKNVQDFFYIVSQMDKVVTVDTSTYHISDAFFIPTVVFFSDTKYLSRAKYYGHTIPVYIEDQSLNFSHFKFDNDELILHQYENWKDIKTSRVIKLLETI